MLTIKEVIKTLYNALLQRLKKHRGNWDQNDPSADDYIKNRPFYTDETKKIVNVPEQTITITNASPFTYLVLSEFIEFVAGQTYEVKWDNKIYSCVAFNGDGIGVIGNQGVFGNGTDTGEPFIMMISKAEGMGMVIAPEAIGTHTVEVTSVKIVKIDKKYLPDLGLAPVATSGSYDDLEDTPTIYTDVVRYGTSQSLSAAQKTQARTNIGAGIGDVLSEDLATVATSGSYNDLGDQPFGVEIRSEVLNGMENISRTMGSVSSGNGTSCYLNKSGVTFTEKFVVGQKYKVIINGQETILEAKQTDFIGNRKIKMPGSTAAGNPEAYFYIELYLDLSRYILFLASSWYGDPVTVSIYKYSETINLLDEKFIPDTIARVTDIPAPVEYVHATSNDDGSFSLDKTYDEIMAAYDAGRKVQCEMRFTADAGAGAYIFDLVTFGPYAPDPYDGDTVYNGALFVLWMQNRMMRMLVTTDNQVMMFQTNRFQTEGELQIRYGNELMYAGHMGVDVDVDLNIPINAPKNYVAFTDQVNGYIYYVSMRNGTLVSTCAIKTIEVASMPTTVEYTAGDVFDPSGLTLRATRYDGTPVEVTDFTYDAPEMLTEDVTAIPVTYTDMGVAYTVDVPITVNPFDPEVILMDFEYTDNGDGTYTITGWKGTNNGEASTEMIIPNYSCIIV